MLFQRIAKNQGSTTLNYSRLFQDRNNLDIKGEIRQLLKIFSKDFNQKLLIKTFYGEDETL